MSNQFTWNPVEDQIYDASYGIATLSQQEEVEGYSSYSFCKINSNFDLSAKTVAVPDYTLTFNVSSDVTSTQNHIYWTSESYGKSINIVNGSMRCNGFNSNYQQNVYIVGESENCLNLNIYDGIKFGSYQTILMQNVDMNIKNIGYMWSMSTYFIITGYSVNVVLLDNSYIIISAINGIHIDNVNFDINTLDKMGLYLSSLRISFFNYALNDNRGIALHNNSKGLVQGALILLNDAKIFVNDTAILNIEVDQLDATNGGRFTVSESGKINFTGYTKLPLPVPGSIAAPYPVGLYAFDAPHGAIDAYFKFGGNYSDSDINFMLSNKLISVNGNTDQLYLQDVLIFEIGLDNGGRYLKIHMKK